MKVQSIISILIFGLFFMFTSCSDSGLEPTVPDPMEEENEGNEGNEGNMGNTGGEELATAPNFSIKTFDGEELNLDNYKDKVLVIWFFGSECPPCIGIGGTVEEQLNKPFKDIEDYAIIGMDQWDKNDATVEGFKSKTGVEFPLGTMASSVASDYDTTYDRLVVINRDGKIAYKAESRANKTLEEVETLVRKLVN